jgi:hypothetical protein
MLLTRVNPTARSAFQAGTLDRHQNITDAIESSHKKQAPKETSIHLTGSLHIHHCLRPLQLTPLELRHTILVKHSYTRHRHHHNVALTPPQLQPYEDYPHTSPRPQPHRHPIYQPRHRSLNLSQCQGWNHQRTPTAVTL